MAMREGDGLESGGTVPVIAPAAREAPVQRFASSEDEEFWNLYQVSRSAALRKVHRRFETLSRRLERIESIVTHPNYDMKREFENL